MDTGQRPPLAYFQAKALHPSEEPVSNAACTRDFLIHWLGIQVLQFLLWVYLQGFLKPCCGRGCGLEVLPVSLATLSLIPKASSAGCCWKSLLSYLLYQNPRSSSQRPYPGWTTYFTRRLQGAPAQGENERERT